MNDIAYAVTFAMELRRKVFYGEKRYAMEKERMFRSVSGFMGFLKGKSRLLIYEQWSNMK